MRLALLFILVCVFCFLFVFCLPLFGSCLVLFVASWGRVNLAVSSSLWEWRFLCSYERYFCWNEPKHCLSYQYLLWYLFLWNLQSESLEESVLQFWVQLWSRLGTSHYTFFSKDYALIWTPDANCWELGADSVSQRGCYGSWSLPYMLLCWRSLKIQAISSIIIERNIKLHSSFFFFHLELIFFQFCWYVDVGSENLYNLIIKSLHNNSIYIKL